MLPRCALLSSLFLLAACDGTAAAVGTYELDRQALAASLKEASKGLAAPLLQRLAESASGTIELRADGSASMQLNLLRSTTGNGTWKLDSRGITMNLEDDKGHEQVVGCGYDGKSIAIQEVGPGGVHLQMLWNRR
ncbi:MAG: hypothetical protein KDC48_19275 [Planctomycetes bacterium]|nr:hypothetical protein [Planctomycetota bacterium]